MRLLTIHNLAYLQRLMAELRAAIDEGRLAAAAAAVRGGAAPWELGVDDFKAFEARGWSARAGTYDALMARATAVAIEPLLDAAARRRRACACSTSAAGRARSPRRGGARRARHRRGPRRGHAGRGAPAPSATSTFVARRRRSAAVRRRGVRRRARRFLVNHRRTRATAVAELGASARRVALAAWGPEDEVAFLALPARAAARPRRRPRRPETPSATPTAAAPARRRRVGGAPPSPPCATTLHVDSLDALWDGIRGGTVRTAARLEAAPDDRAEPAPSSPRSPSRTAPPTGYDAAALTILIART